MLISVFFEFMTKAAGKQRNLIRMTRQQFGQIMKSINTWLPWEKHKMSYYPYFQLNPLQSFQMDYRSIVRILISLKVISAFFHSQFSASPHHSLVQITFFKCSNKLLLNPQATACFQKHIRSFFCSIMTFTKTSKTSKFTVIQWVT